MYPRDTHVSLGYMYPWDTCHYMSLHVITCHHMSFHVITWHYMSSLITPDHPKDRCPFWVKFSSIFGGSRDHLGVILGSSFTVSRGVPNIKVLINFCVFGKMSGDPPGGLLGPLGGFSLCRFYKKMTFFWWSQNRSRTPPGVFLAHPWKNINP